MCLCYILIENLLQKQNMPELSLLENSNKRSQKWRIASLLPPLQHNLYWQKMLCSLQ